MTLEVVCGLNWGDEGKGRMVDYLAQDADFVVRYQGGNNAGHTVINDHGRFALHLIPSGIFNPASTNVLGPGMVIDLEGFCNEVDELTALGVDCSNVLVSERATIVFPFHKDQDSWEEDRLDERAYGSTKNGIAPAYGDRYMKKAIQVGALARPEALVQQIVEVVKWKNLTVAGPYGYPAAFQAERMIEWVRTYGEPIRERLADTSGVLWEAANAGKKVLFEAQLGALRDIYYGTYPFTTSSCTLAAYAPIGSGLFGRHIDRVLGVAKAFSTCVGEGPFVTQMDDEEAGALREVAQEYGATTGRPRSIGHFDAVATRYGARVQGASEIALTKLDSLSGRKPLRICTHYLHDGRRIDTFPLNAVLDAVTPSYIELDGWIEDLSNCRDFQQLPKAAQVYVETIERLVECPIRYVSVGPERGQLMSR